MYVRYVKNDQTREGVNSMASGVYRVRWYLAIGFLYWRWMKYYLMINFKVSNFEWSENSNAIKQAVVYSVITNFLKKQYSFKNAKGSVQNNISTFCQVADQLIQQNNDFFFVLNYVVFIDFYGSLFCWLFHIFKYTIVYCHIMYVHDVIKCVFLFSLEVSWQLFSLSLVIFR